MQIESWQSQPLLHWLSRDESGRRSLPWLEQFANYTSRLEERARKVDMSSKRGEKTAVVAEVVVDSYPKSSREQRPRMKGGRLMLADGE